ncbi:MAG TPA: hypothetical protein VFP84_05365 [Kofleriaceae bacterium]|nr:hypothetical protein [Kofleriaceae bacterium]
MCLVGGAPPAAAEPAPAAPAASVACTASASWFTNPSFPGEVPGGTKASLCSFEQFAWQAFIDLVQPVGSQPGARTFETFMPDYGVFVPSNVKVTPWGEQPDVPCTLAAADAKDSKRIFLRPRVAKGPGPGFDPNSDLQASGQALYDQDREVVYYSIWINQTEYDFITKCDFNDTSCVTSAPKTSAITTGAVEIKGAWRVFNGPAPNDMYSIRGVVSPIGKDHKPSKMCKPVTLGLVGFHVVVNTPLHPEFIWATFEHKRNAPDCTNPQKAPPGGWSFNNPACPKDAKDCKPNKSNKPPTPTQVCRVAPQGSGAGEHGAQNSATIEAINQSAHETLAQLLKASPAKYAAMAIWQNYDLTGNIWTHNGQLPPNRNNEAGSLLAANTTMETYVQGPPTAGMNCFDCHKQKQFVLKSDGKNVPKGFPDGAPANFSHLWGFAQRTGGCGDGKGPLPAACPLNAPTGSTAH